MPDHEESWTSDGQVWRVEVECAPQQSETECFNEFREAVAVLKALHPPD